MSLLSLRNSPSKRDCQRCAPLADVELWLFVPERPSVWGSGSHPDNVVEVPKVHSAGRYFRLGSSYPLGSWHRNPCADRLPHLSELSGGSLLLAGAY